MSVAPHDEPEPLLPREEAETSEGPQSLSWLRPVAAVKKFWSGQSTPVLCCTCLLYFLISFSKHIVEVPSIRLFELAACHSYYARQQGSIGNHGYGMDDRLCKAPAVQNELSTLTGWKFGFDAAYVQPSFRRQD